MSKRIIVAVAAICVAAAYMSAWAGTAVWKSNAGGDITEPTNWEGDVAPAADDTLDFSAITSAQTLTGVFEDNRAFSCAKFGTGIVTLEGNLHFTTLTNANKLAVASTGVLRIDKDLAAFQYTYNKNAYMTFLRSNEGDVSVGGYAVGGADVSGCGNYGHVRQYETHTSASTPIKAKGLRCLIAYTTSPLFYLATASAAGEWIVGSGGLAIENGQNNDRVNYRVEGAATLRSTDNWTLGKSAKNSVNKDLYVTGSGNLVIDTTDYDDGTTPHTVTLGGRLVADKVQGAATVAIVGCGTNVIATSVSHGENRSTKIENAISVEGTATLQINAGASYIISNIVVASGATLHVPSTAVNTSATTIIRKATLADGATLSLPSASATALTARTIPLTLPAEGRAYLRIDGPELKKGEYTVLSPVTDGYASHLSVVGTALGNRRARLSDDGASLKLVIPPKGLVIIFH
ncbi:MAG: hypothetical protein J6T51_02800 [Kiritimatiellae bacterium]|nr:hypothetical protein [Kiritimatiellia bacterium]